MFHTVNTVRMAGGDLKRFARDPIAAFREAGQDTLGGIRTVTARALRTVHDIDIRPGIENAILYGVTPKPIDVGDQAQTIGPNTPRNIQEVEPNEFKAGLVTLNVAPVVIYRPTRPELIHRIIVGHTNLAAQLLLLGTQDELLIPGANFNSNYLFFNEVLPDTTFTINLGRIGSLITPNNPLSASSGAGIGWRIVLQLSQALVTSTL